MKTGKWIIKEIKVRWFCRNCWQRGVAAVTINPKPNVKLSDKQMVDMIQTTCHTNCKEPDVRIHYYDSKSQYPKAN